MPLDQARKKQLRAIGHQLRPVVMIAERGATEGVNLELERALEDHELIKVKVAGLDRDVRNNTIAAICEKTGAELVQRIGNIALIYRAAAKPNPKLSNLLRPQG